MQMLFQGGTWGYKLIVEILSCGHYPNTGLYNIILLLISHKDQDFKGVWNY